MRVLVTGSSGMLGGDICRLLDASNHEVFGVDKHVNEEMKDTKRFEGDLAKPAFVDDVLRASNPEMIVHCAAIVDVDRCETDRELAYSVHVGATSQLASYKPGRVRFVYISTDSVFDGQVGGYSEEDDARPLNYYAFSKLQGENLALQKNPNSAVLRTNIFGFHKPLGKSLAEWAIANLLMHKTINGFCDTVFNPIYTKQLAQVISEHFVADSLCGRWHIASEGYVSKHEFLVKLARVFRVPESLVVRNLSTNTKFVATRPKRTYLNTDKLKSTVGVELDLQSGLESLRMDYLRSTSTGHNTTRSQV